MKKTKLMRAALLLLVLTLVTSCFVGGTFAKYTTSAEGSDTARVAKWGVKITANGATFAKEYDSGVATKTVLSADDSKVVAPGTKGDMVKMTITGTPEVAVSVNYAANFKVEGWTVDNQFYCPLQITVGNTTIDGATFTDAGRFEDEVTELIRAYNKSYAAGTDLSTTGVTAPSVSWAWPFEDTNTTGTGVENHQTNEKDTALGNAGTAKISLEVTTTVTQID